MNVSASWAKAAVARVWPRCRSWAWSITRGRSNPDASNLAAPIYERSLRTSYAACVVRRSGSSFSIGTQLIDVVRAHRKVSKSEAAALAIEKLKLVGIPAPESRMRAYPWELSGGQRQRVAIAMALLLGPKLIIADEPTTALDVSIQAQIVDLLISLKNELDFSLIFVSHDLGVIQTVANRVMVMYAGRMMESGGVGSLFRDPAHPYTAALLASAPTLKTNRGLPLQAIEGRLPSPGNLPPGCIFAPRCHYAQDDCLVRQPPLAPIGGNGRQVACIHPLLAPPAEAGVR